MTFRGIQKACERRKSPLKVVLLYAHKDRKRVDAIRKHLIPLEGQGLIVLWSDVEIVPGHNWNETIREKIGEADIACLCISADIFASKYIREVELPNILALEKFGKIVICPVIICPCLWEEMLDLGRLQALPSGAKAVTTWRNRDEAGVSVAEGLHRLVLELLAKRVGAGDREAA